MTTTVQQPERRSRSNLKSSFQVHMALADLTILAISAIGCILAAIHVDFGRSVDLSLIVFMALLLTLIFLYRDNKDRRMAAVMTIPWIFLLIPILVYPMLIAGRLDLQLRDADLAHIDQLFGVSVPGMVTWAAHHPIGEAISRTYSFLLFPLIAAAFLPALTGKLKAAREFLIANLVAVAIGMPLFALLPAVGPWYLYHFHPNLDQARCQAQLLLLRSPGIYNSSEAAGVVCFPSFHVIWAILCPAALWDFRWLRIPVALLSVAIILSTMTTGWHYFSDVLGGILVASLAVVVSKIYTSRFNSDFDI